VWIKVCNTQSEGQVRASDTADLEGGHSNAHLIGPDSEAMLEADADPSGAAATRADPDAKVDPRATRAPLRSVLFIILTLSVRMI
jgi:hypothetical protein